MRHTTICEGNIMRGFFGQPNATDILVPPPYCKDRESTYVFNMNAKSAPVVSICYTCIYTIDINIRVHVSRVDVASLCENNLGLGPDWHPHFHFECRYLPAFWIQYPNRVQIGPRLGHLRHLHSYWFEEYYYCFHLH